LARLQKIEDQEYLESGAVVLKAAVSSFRNQEKDGDDHWRVITRRMKTPELIQHKKNLKIWTNDMLLYPKADQFSYDSNSNLLPNGIRTAEMGYKQ
jgi:hypothetical protein